MLRKHLIPQGTSVKYLGMHLDSKLTWREHIINKGKQLDHKTRKLLWIIGRKSPLSLENKLLIYKTVLKPVWTYGIELWGCARKQTSQSYNATSRKFYESSQKRHGTFQIRRYILICAYKACNQSGTNTPISTSQHWNTIQIPS